MHELMRAARCAHVRTRTETHTHTNRAHAHTRTHTHTRARTHMAWEGEQIDTNARERAGGGGGGGEGGEKGSERAESAFIAQIKPKITQNYSASRPSPLFNHPSAPCVLWHTKAH